jgi:peptidoglycan/LPS O-acetylase OafA/YrhL
MLQALHGVDDDGYAPGKQYAGTHYSPKDRITPIAIGIAAVALLSRQTLKVPRQPQRNGIAQIMQGIGQDGNAAAPISAPNLYNRENGIQPKGCAYIVMAAVCMMVMVPHSSFTPPVDGSTNISIFAGKKSYCCGKKQIITI